MKQAASTADGGGGIKPQDNKGKASSHRLRGYEFLEALRDVFFDDNVPYNVESAEASDENCECDVVLSICISSANPSSNIPALSN